MKRINAFPYVVVFVTALLTISCQKEKGGKQDMTTPSPDGTITLTDYEIASIAYAHPKELSTQDALSILRHFEDSISRTPGTKSTSKSTFEVIGKSYINEKGSSSQVATKGSAATTVPVFNVVVKKGAQRGLAVVSGDERVPFVIAYTQEAKGTADPMLLLSQLSLVDKVKEVEKIVDSLYAPTISKLEQKFGRIPGNNVFDFVKRHIATTNERPGTKSEVIPGGSVNQYLLGPARAL
ncbi:Spi family protease inhibitor [Chitinophaga qingshengii]|uniref:Spi family protease inhibitor n=1 Tax=Chitinophaga qingshengii TaxID=1569794 RepID=A0ABR7TVR0_9BACT|nr:Spi family protease inhibitor [Chitinophaga qingshengii]MBC9934140.1 Spi family protease inhibitor [Chitinophaga qingshengii]